LKGEKNVMPPVAAVAGSILAPAVSQVVTSVVGDIAKSALGGGANPANLLGGIGDAFAALFGKQQQQPSIFPNLPLPFAGGGLPFNNPLGILQNSLGLFKSITPSLQSALGGLGGASGFAAAGSRGAAGSQTSQFGVPDQLNAQAQALLQPGPNGEPPSMENILKAQQLMAAANMLFEKMSKQIEMLSNMFSKAVNAIQTR
jgi:hypothetical protein